MTSAVIKEARIVLAVLNKEVWPEQRMRMVVESFHTPCTVNPSADGIVGGAAKWRVNVRREKVLAASPPAKGCANADAVLVGPLDQ